MEAASHVAYPPTHPAANKPKQERPPTAADHAGQQQFYHPPHLPPPQPQNPFQTNFHRPPPPMQSLPSFMPPHNQMEEEPPSAAPNPPQEADNIVLPHPNARPFMQDGSLYYVQKLQKPYMPPQGGQVNPGTPPRGEAPLTDGDGQQNKQLTPNQKEMIGMYAGRTGFERTPDKNGKRKRNEGVEQAEEVRKERHNMAEKKRRSDMNDAIERLRALLPQQVTAEKRLTKVEVLIEAADHLTQVQNLCAKLIAENNGMKGAPPPGAMPGPDTRPPPVSVEAVRGRNPVNEEDEEEESEEEENDGEEDDYRRKDADQNGRARKDAVAPSYAQMHHQHRPEGDKVEDVGGRGMESHQHIPQMTQQMTQQQMPPQHLQQHQHQPQQMPQPQKGRDRP